MLEFNMSHLMTESLPARTRTRIRAELIGLATKDQRLRRPFYRRRAAVVAAGAAVVLGVGGTAAAVTWMQPEPVQDRDTARCYSTISNDFSMHFPGTTIASPVASDGSGGQVANPLEACAAAWRAGLLYGISPHNATGTYDVPPLTVCVLPDGSAAVYPGTADTCAKVGLPAVKGA